MINKVKDFIVKNNLINEGDKILVALSGGPDSVCLLHILDSIKDEFKITIGAAHVNHMMRGEEADGDEEYAKKICEKLGIEFYSIKVNINKISKERKISCEMAGRDERYKFFETLKDKYGYNKISVAHNANDQAETILMNIMRGTGIDGLGGIKVKRENGVIRPILCLIREEIEKYCDKKSLNPRIDKTNLENIYSRNKVRLDILPYMKKNFNSDIIEALNRMSNLLQIDNDFIEKECNNRYTKYCIIEKDFVIIKKDAFSLDRAILTRLIKKAFIDIAKKFNNFEMKHIQDVIDLSFNSTNKKIDLPNNIIAENIYGDIKIKNKSFINENIKSEVSINKEELDDLSTEYGDFKVKFNIIKDKKIIKFSNNLLIKYFDYDNIEDELVIRIRKNGDKITPLGMKGNKKIKDIFMDLKVPVEERDRVPILCFDDEIAWVVGYKVSEKFKITSATKNIIKITFTRKEAKK